MPLVDSRTTMVNKSNAKKGRYFLKYTIYKREGKKNLLSFCLKAKFLL